MMPCEILDAMSSKLPANISKLELGTVCDWEKLFTKKFHIDAALNSKNVFANLLISSPEFGTIFEATKSFLHEGILVTVDAIPCCHLNSNLPLSEVCDWIHSTFAVIEFYQVAIAVVIIIFNAILSLLSLIIND